jgi:hypothetical protein
MLPKILKGSLPQLLSSVPPVFKAPLEQAQLASQARAAAAAATERGAADLAWQHLGDAISQFERLVRGSTDSPHGSNLSTTLASPAAARFKETRATAATGAGAGAGAGAAGATEAADTDAVVVATVGPVESAAAGVELCDRIGATICTHQALVRTYGSGLASCHACGWTRSWVQGESVFLAEAMHVRDCDDATTREQVGLTMCAVDAQLKQVHCCLQAGTVADSPAAVWPWA